MASVTQRIKKITQPRGGFLTTKSFVRTQLNDGKSLCEVENIHATTIGLAVDYLTRFMMGESLEKAFSISLKGAFLVNEMSTAHKLLASIKGLDNHSITAACKLAGFDVCYRSSPLAFKPINLINPDRDTISNIKIMVERSICFFKQYGPIVTSGFTFEGGYTDTVDSGDGDFCTKDTLWDFKVSKKHITPAHTLQLLMYYIMGLHSKHTFFQDIKNLGFFNPRLNIVYLCPVSNISDEIIKNVQNDVLCYGVTAPSRVVLPPSSHPAPPKTPKRIDLTVDDVHKMTEISKSEIYRAIRSGHLISHKQGDKYIVSQKDLFDFLAYRTETNHLTIVFLTILSLILFILCVKTFF